MDIFMKNNKKEMQCMTQMNLQLLKAQTHYSNVFVRCYECLREFLHIRNQKALENFLEQLECFTAMVRKWNNEYPGIEAQIKKEYNKEAIKKEIKSYLNQFKGGKNKEIENYLQKFLNLIDQKNENLIGDEQIYKDIQKKPMNAEEINKIGYNIQKGYYEVEKYFENQKNNDFPDFNHNINNNYNYNHY